MSFCVFWILECHTKRTGNLQPENTRTEISNASDNEAPDGVL